MACDLEPSHPFLLPLPAAPGVLVRAHVSSWLAVGAGQRFVDGLLPAGLEHTLMDELLTGLR